eukprot:scaffold4600_cov245-Pinguiococcus_pyrenoidosus.AAC.1
MKGAAPDLAPQSVAAPVKQPMEPGKRARRLALLTALVFGFFSCHNYAQEAIMALPGMHFGAALGLLEVLGVM